MDSPIEATHEVPALKEYIDQQNERIAKLEATVGDLRKNLPTAQTPQSIGRRGLMAGGGLGLLGLLAASGNAAGATDPNDGNGDLGTAANPWDTYLDGLALVTEQVSTSTTVTKPVVLYDSSLSSITLTISSDLEGPSGYSQPVVFIDRTGNADTNNVTVHDSGGGEVAVIPAENSIFETWWDSGEWVTDRFIPSVDAGTVTTGDLEFDSQQPQDVTGSRTTGTWETNNTNHPRIVYVTAATAKTDTHTVAVTAHVNTSQSNNAIVRNSGQSNGTIRGRGAVSFKVPPGHDYKVETDGDVALDPETWFEAEDGDSGD